MFNSNKQVQMPKEHPILRNMFMCIFCLLVIAPIIISLIGRAIEYSESTKAVKSEETIGEVVEYTLITNSNGDTKSFNTTVDYNVDGVDYEKVFNTTFFVAEKGQYIKMYYEKGNPYSVSVTKSSESFSSSDKLNMYTVLCMIIILLFSYNAYVDIGKARDRKMMWAQNQSGMINNNINSNQYSSFNNKTPGW